jgi:hypothetical protein
MKRVIKLCIWSILDHEVYPLDIGDEGFVIKVSGGIVHNKRQRGWISLEDVLEGCCILDILGC